MSAKQLAMMAVWVMIAAFAGFFVGRCSYCEESSNPVPRIDTLVVHDTTTIVEPRYITKRVIDSVMVPVGDTIRLHDTLYVYLAREQVRWEDSLSVVYASGINPKVDSVVHFNTATIITKEIPVYQVRKCKWGLGFDAGYGIGKDGLTPYVGVGIHYNLFSW